MTTKKQQAVIDKIKLLAQAKAGFVFLKNEADRIHTDLKAIKLIEIKIYSPDGRQGHVEYLTNYFNESHLKNFEKICKSNIYSFHVFSTCEHDKRHDGYNLEVEFNFTNRDGRPQLFKQL